MWEVYVDGWDERYMWYMRKEGRWKAGEIAYGGRATCTKIGASKPQHYISFNN